jgi:hypothetical protein
MSSAIDIGSKALDFIKQRGGVLTVRLSPKYGCCGGLANVAIAEAKAPADPSLYQRHRDEGITLFIAEELVDQGLRVGVEGFWTLRHLYVDCSNLHSGHTNKH